MQSWTHLHRGQYLTVESQGYEVRVPYYQFPLIFGNMFGDGAYDYENSKSLSSRNRTFNTSFGGNNVMSATWMSYVQNLFVMRILGGYVWKSHDDFKTKYSSHVKKDGKNYYKVNRESFNAASALNKVQKLTAYVYRVNSHDLTTAQYRVDSVGAAAIDAEGSWFSGRNIEMIGNTVNARLSAFDSPEVKVNGTVFMESKPGSEDYVNMTLAPEPVPTEDETGTRPSRVTTSQILDNMNASAGFTPSGDALKNALAYTRFCAKLKSSISAGVDYYNAIKAQDEAVAAYVLDRLKTEDPTMAVMFLKALNGSDSTDSPTTTTYTSKNSTTTTYTTTTPAKTSSGSSILQRAASSKKKRK